MQSGPINRQVCLQGLPALNGRVHALAALLLFVARPSPDSGCFPDALAGSELHLLPSAVLMEQLWNCFDTMKTIQHWEL